MQQNLRITHHKQDHTFQILNSDTIDLSTREIQIVVQGHNITLKKEAKGWIADNAPDKDTAELAAAIGKSIALRYRI